MRRYLGGIRFRRNADLEALAMKIERPIDDGQTFDVLDGDFDLVVVRVRHMSWEQMIKMQTTRRAVAHQIDAVDLGDCGSDDGDGARNGYAAVEMLSDQLFTLFVFHCNSFERSARRATRKQPCITGDDDITKWLVGQG